MAVLRRRSVVTAIVLVVLIGGYLGFRFSRPAGITVTADFSATVAVYPGSSVRMLGVQVGTVDHVRTAGTEVIVTMTISHGHAAAADTGAVILSPSLVGDRYVQLTDIWSSGPKLASGAVIPMSRTATPVELDQLNQSLVTLADALGPNGANKDGALSNLLDTAAANLQGNGTEFNQTLTALSQASQTLSSSQTNLFGTVNNLKTFTAALAQSDAGVAGFNSQLAQLSTVLSNDRQSFTEALQQLSSALGLVSTFISSNRSLLTANVSRLSTITAALATEKASIAETLTDAPDALQNLLNAYDPTTGTLDGRGDLNELTIWAQDFSSTESSPDTSSSSSSSRSSRDAPSGGATVTSQAGTSTPMPPLLLASGTATAVTP